MWTLDNVRIITQDQEADNKQIIPRLQPINGGTHLQIFGYESEILRLSTTVVGSGDLFALKDMAKDGLYHTLISPLYSGEYLVTSLKHKWVQSICQSLRPDLPEDSPVFTVDIELQIED
jgi:hypothetical protein